MPPQPSGIAKQSVGWHAIGFGMQPALASGGGALASEPPPPPHPAKHCTFLQPSNFVVQSVGKQSTGADWHVPPPSVPDEQPSLQASL